MTDEQSAAGAAFARQRAAMAVQGMTAPEMHVLLILAVMANEAAQCWPAIRGPAGLAAKTGLSDRTITRALRALEAAGHITTSRIEGKGSIYTVHPGQRDPGQADPCHPVTPDSVSPLTESPGTPDSVSPKQPRTTIVKKKRTSSSPSTRNAFPMPEGVNPAHWRDFLAARARKRLANTASAHSRLMHDLDRLAGDDWPIPRLIQHAAERGWGGIYDPRGTNDDQRNRALGRPQRGSTTDAYLEAFRRTGAGNERLPD